MIVALIGWIGTLMVVGSYALVSLRLISSSSIWIAVLNILGPIGVSIPAALAGLWNVVALQIIWLMITIVGLFRRRKLSP